MRKERLHLNELRDNLLFEESIENKDEEVIADYKESINEMLENLSELTKLREKTAGYM